jgi:hypothetical protein
MKRNGLITHYLRTALKAAGVKIDGDMNGELSDIDDYFMQLEERLAKLEANA